MPETNLPETNLPETNTAPQPEVDAWFAVERPRREVLLALRALLLDLGLSETLKWRQPCYVLEGRNIAIVGLRKDACVVSVLSGALLDDPTGELQSAGPNTRAARLLRFESVDDVHQRMAIVRGLLEQAIALARDGRRVELEPANDPVPDELRERLEHDPELRDAFDALTPGRRRGYLLHFNGARQSSTRAARIEKSRARILAGKGRHDCICGRSTRMPRCDGSHKTG